MFTPEQIEKLTALLPRELVRERQQAGRKLSYIEGYTAIEAANNIFGFGMWRTEILGLEVIHSAQGEDKYGNPRWEAGYRAWVRVTVRNSEGGNTAYEDIGFGSGFGTVTDAHESAGKEAVTDALKRALRHLGNQFGLALYDKDQKNVAEPVEASNGKSKVPAHKLDDGSGIREGQSGRKSDEISASDIKTKMQELAAIGYESQAEDVKHGYLTANSVEYVKDLPPAIRAEMWGVLDMLKTKPRS